MEPIYRVEGATAETSAFAGGPWDPKLQPADYKYGQFGYFLLMNEAWHQLRLRIGFDLENV